MQNNKILIGGIVGGITFFILGFLLYGLLLMDFFEANTLAGVYKPTPDFPMLIIGQLFYGFLYALVIGSWAKASSAADGAKKGLVFSLLMGAAYDITMYGTSNIMPNMTGMIADIAVVIVMGVIVGAVIGAVMSPKKA